MKTTSHGLSLLPTTPDETTRGKLHRHTTGAVSGSRHGMLLPKPLGVMTYAEMSAEVARSFLKNAVLAAEIKRLTRENAALKRRNGSAELALKQNREYYECEVVRLNTELSRVRNFADSIVHTI